MILRPNDRMDFGAEPYGIDLNNFQNNPNLQSANVQLRNKYQLAFTFVIVLHYFILV